MGHRCSCYARIESDLGRIYRFVRAEYGIDPETQEVLHSLDIFKEDLITGKKYCRNVDFSMLGGWLVTFPGEKKKLSYYGRETIQELEDWWEVKIQCTGFDYCYNETSVTTLKMRIVEKHPELKYLMNKLNIPNNFNYAKLFEIIRCYWNHPESETMFELGLYNLAMNENLYKLSKDKLKQVLSIVNEMRREGTLQDIKLKDIQKYNKLKSEYNLSFSEWYSYWHWDDMETKSALHLGFETYKYCKKKNVGKYEYRDYVNMAEKVGHDIKEEYWKYPNNFRKMHDLVMSQVKALEIAKYGIQQDFLKEILKPMLKYNSQVDGYDIFISTSAEEWQLTCDTLYQCLLRNGYMKNVIMQQDIIVFIWKDGKPVATAQLDYDKKVGQFYGDESKHSLGESCLPSKEVEQAFYKWLETFKPKKARFEYTKKEDKFYKGFQKHEGNTLYTSVGKMDGNGKGSTFVIGNVYNTDFDDEEIMSTGKNCRSTEKVFHFCSSISEIAKHYAASYYAEVKPLGPVIDDNGALLTNKLEIVRVIPEAEIQHIIAKEKLQQLGE